MTFPKLILFFCRLPLTHFPFRNVWSHEIQLQLFYLGDLATSHDIQYTQKKTSQANVNYSASGHRPLGWGYNVKSSPIISAIAKFTAFGPSFAKIHSMDFSSGLVLFFGIWSSHCFDFILKNGFCFGKGGWGVKQACFSIKVFTSSISFWHV